MYICITGATYIHTKTRLVTTDCNTTGQENKCHPHSRPWPYLSCGLTSPPATLPAPKLCSASQLGSGKGVRGEEKVHAMVIGRRLGSGRMRNGSFMPRCLSLCPQALATLAGGKTGVSVHSISLLDSLSFWFLLGGCPTSCANGVEHSGMSWGAKGGCVYLWGWDDKVYTYFRR